jgi:hypothetical protein
MSRIISEKVIGEDRILVKLEEVSAMVSTTLPSTMLWLSYDEADRLAFQLNSTLQDIERAKEKA